MLRITYVLHSSICDTKLDTFELSKAVTITSGMILERVPDLLMMVKGQFHFH